MGRVGWPVPASPEIYATVALGKRRGDESYEDEIQVVMNSYEMPPQKRVRSDKPNGILDLEGSVVRT